MYAYTSQVAGYYGSVRSVVDGYRARQLARAGMEAGILTLRGVPEELIYTLGIVANPPRLLIAQSCNDEKACTKYYLSYSLQPEDGKLNLNLLVNASDELDNGYFNIFSRLFSSLKIDIETLGAIIDWIDQNGYLSSFGAEKEYYLGLNPPRKIKNNYMFHFSELSAIKGFTRELLYSSRPSATWENDRKNRASSSELENLLLQNEDWILANNVTAYLPRTLQGTEKVSINAARYHVLQSLSSVMGTREVRAIFNLRQRKEGYIKNKSDVESLPELKRLGELGSVPLSQELFGTGNLSGYLKTNNQFWRITGIGYIVIGTDNNEKSLAIRKITGLWDKNSNEFIYYSED